MIPNGEVFARVVLGALWSWPQSAAVLERLVLIMTPNRFVTLLRMALVLATSGAAFTPWHLHSGARIQSRRPLLLAKADPEAKSKVGPRWLLKPFFGGNPAFERFEEPGWWA